jgi:hypothetical protein
VNGGRGQHERPEGMVLSPLRPGWKSSLPWKGVGPTHPVPEYLPGTTTARRWSSDGLVRVFTRRYRTLLYAFVPVFGCVLSVGPPSEIAGRTAMRISALVIFSAFALLGWRVLRLAIIVRPDRVVIRNLVATHRIDPASIDHFDPPHRSPLRTGVRAVHADGRFISASAFAKMNNFERPDRGLYETAELNSWLAESRSPTGPVQLRPREPVSAKAKWWWRCWLLFLAAETIFAAAAVISFVTDPFST